MENTGAHAIAAKALIFIAQDPDRIGGFLAQSGVGPAEIRTRTQDPAFLGGILDYLLADESMLLDFAGWAGVDASQIATLRRQLPGGDWL